MFGEDHAYGVPLTGSGFESSVSAITRDDLVDFHKTLLRPDLATLVVVGDVKMEQLQPLLELAFGSWKSPETAPREKNLVTVENREQTKIFLVNKPNAEQSVIIGGLLAPTRKESDIPMKLVNGVLGGQFTSRLNMNLREDKHWSYGSYSFIWTSQNQRIFAFYASVQTDKSAESLGELGKELNAIIGDKPPTEDEVLRLRDNYTLKLPGKNETTSELLRNIAEIVEYQLPDEYWQNYVSEVRGLPLEELKKTAKRVILPGRVAWIVVGDLTKIQKPLEALGIGDVEVLLVKD